MSFLFVFFANSGGGEKGELIRSGAHFWPQESLNLYFLTQTSITKLATDISHDFFSLLKSSSLLKRKALVCTVPRLSHAGGNCDVFFFFFSFYQYWRSSRNQNNCNIKACSVPPMIAVWLQATPPSPSPPCWP